MSKPGRMITIGIAAPPAFAAGDARWLAVGAAVIMAGALLPLAARLHTSWRELERGG